MHKSEAAQNFQSVGNMGCRQWWGKPCRLNNRDLGVWGGNYLMGVNGTRAGRFESAFEKWCRERGHLCVRTVNLFWAFEYHRKGFPTRLLSGPLKTMWREAKRRRREAPRRIREATFIYLNCDLKKMSATQLKQFIDDWFPAPGPWQAFYAERGSYFQENLERYRSVKKFWNECAQARKLFLRCASFSNRRPESHPDYLVQFRDQNHRNVKCAFVEVKSPRESIRPSQRRFFPELVRGAGQRIMLARINENAKNVRFFEIESNGQLMPCVTSSDPFFSIKACKLGVTVVP